jgi:hypothetical protein
VDDLAVDVQDEGAARMVRPSLLGGSDRHAHAPVGLPAADAGEPPRIRRVELDQGLLGARRIREGVVVDRRAAEVAGAASAEAADDDVRQLPGDCGEGCRSRLGVGEVDGRAAVGEVDVPGPGGRLPEVLRVGQPVEPRSQLGPPVPVELVDGLGRPSIPSCRSSVVMSSTLSALPDRS